MFWKRFYELCVQRNTRPNIVCKELNLSNATATHWKNGKIPNGETLQSLADYFGVTTDYLLGRTDEPTPPKTQPIVIMAKGGDGQDVIEVSEEQYNKIKKLLEIMDEDN